MIQVNTKDLFGSVVSEKMISLSHFDQETPMSKRIPISHFNTECIFETKRGDLGAVIKVRGIPFEVEGVSQLNYLQNTLSFLVQRLDHEFAIYVTTHRHPESCILEGNYSGFAKSFFETYQQKFSDNSFFVNDIYITLLLKPSQAALMKRMPLFNRLYRSKVADNINTWHEKQLQKMQDTLTTVLMALSDYSPLVLGAKEDQQGNEYAEVLRFLSIFINGEAKDYLFPYQDIATFIPQKRLFFGKDAIHFQGNVSRDDRYGAILSIKHYSPFTAPGFLNSLLTLPITYINTHSFLSFPTTEALTQIQKQSRRLLSVGDAARSQIGELEAAMDDVASQRINFGCHHNTIMVFAERLEDLEEKVAQVIKVCADLRLSLVRETLNLESAFWAQVPGNFSRIRRSCLISSHNFTCFCSLHNDYTGYRDQNHLGGALLLAQTQNNTPFYFNLHEMTSGRKEDLAKGHTLMIGATGTGKTVLMLAVDLMMQKYAIRSFIFDRNRGCEIYVRAMGGNYFRLDPSHNTSWNPCQLLDTPENRAFLRDFLKHLVSYGDNKHFTLTAQDETLIADVVTRNYSLPFKDRNLSNIASFFPLDFSGLSALRKWIRLPDATGKGGEYAYLFDNDTDVFNINQNTIGFDMTYLLSAESYHQQQVLTPVMMYLFHRIQLSLDGSLTGVYLDEGWQFLDNGYWLKKLNEYLVTWRKLNAFIFFATQLPDKLAASPLASALIQGAATHIFLPNPKAEEKDYIGSFKLTEKEFEIVKTYSMQSRYFLMKQGHQSAVIKMDFTGMEKYLTVLSGNQKTVALCEKLRKEMGEDPKQWLPLFYEESSQS